MQHGVGVSDRFASLVGKAIGSYEPLGDTPLYLIPGCPFCHQGPCHTDDGSHVRHFRLALKDSEFATHGVYTQV